MPGATPFSSTPQRSDWLLVNQIAYRQARDDYPGAENYLAALGAYTAEKFPGTNPLPSMLLATAGGLSLLSITGTTTALGWAVNFMAFPPVNVIEGVGVTLPGFQTVAWPLWNLVRASLVSLGNPIVLMGHSLGGAVAQLMASYALAEGLNLQSVYVAGSPGVGNSTLANAIGPYVFRLEDTNDPIVALPPVSQGALPNLLYPWSTIDGGLTATRAGAGFTLDAYGQITSGSNLLSLTQALLQLIQGAAPTHLSGEYVRRLIAGGGSSAELLPGAGGYAAPWILYDLAPPTQGLLFTVEGAVLHAEWAAAQNAQRCLPGVCAIQDTSS